MTSHPISELSCPVLYILLEQNRTFDFHPLNLVWSLSVPYFSTRHYHLPRGPAKNPLKQKLDHATTHNF